MERRYENEGNCGTCNSPAEAVWPTFPTDPLPKYFLRQLRDKIESLIKEQWGQILTTGVKEQGPGRAHLSGISVGSLNASWAIIRPQGEADIEEERSNWHFQHCLYQVFCIFLHTYLMLAEAQILVLVFNSLV